jgi:phosphatidylethanolamine/phosphatidyl-N-methylethanolamine N-methyltransferase
MDRDQIIDDYYKRFFGELCGSGIQGAGSNFFHRIIEKAWAEKSELKILEVGCGEGEHLTFLSNQTLKNLKSYYMLDIRATPKALSVRLNGLEKINEFFNPSLFKYVQGSVESIPFPDNYFDRIISTCLFHHLSNPLDGFKEIERVTKPGGEISIGMPCDPGILNRFIKFLITFPKARRIGLQNPELVYALEHPNHIHGLMSIAKFVFSNHQLKFTFHPFKIRSWNANLAIVIRVKIND